MLRESPLPNHLFHCHPKIQISSDSISFQIQALPPLFILLDSLIEPEVPCSQRMGGLLAGTPFALTLHSLPPFHRVRRPRPPILASPPTPAHATGSRKLKTRAQRRLSPGPKLALDALCPYPRTYSYGPNSHADWSMRDADSHPTANQRRPSNMKFVERGSFGGHKRGPDVTAQPLTGHRRGVMGGGEGQVASPPPPPSSFASP